MVQEVQVKPQGISETFEVTSLSLMFSADGKLMKMKVSWEGGRICVCRCMYFQTLFPVFAVL